MSLLFALALRAKKAWAKILFILAFLCVGFSRMYLGCHTPKDVFVSMGLSIIIASVFWHFRSKLENVTTCTAQISVLLGILAFALAGYAWYLYHGQMIALKYAMDCLEAAGAGLGFALGWYLERTHLDFQPDTCSGKGQIFEIYHWYTTTLCVKLIISSIFGSSILAKSAEYFILLLWIIYFYPYLFTKYSKH